MARPLRFQPAGGIFHLTSRGNRRQLIFLDDRDRMRFLALLAQVVSQFGWRCHAYCLMPNHYHLVIETPTESLSRGMQQLNGLYAQYFNRRHGYDGHLFQGRFHSVAVRSRWHLLELTRYIVLNPVRAGLCARAEDWRWSSFGATVAITRRPAFLTLELVLAEFGHDAASQRAAYATFIADSAALRIRDGPGR